jgi:hypothetical protein
LRDAAGREWKHKLEWREWKHKLEWREWNERNSGSEKKSRPRPFVKKHIFSVCDNSRPMPDGTHAIIGVRWCEMA